MKENGLRRKNLAATAAEHRLGPEQKTTMAGRVFLNKRSAKEIGLIHRFSNHDLETCAVMRLAEVAWEHLAECEEK